MEIVLKNEKELSKVLYYDKDNNRLFFNYFSKTTKVIFLFNFYLENIINSNDIKEIYISNIEFRESFNIFNLKRDNLIININNCVFYNYISILQSNIKSLYLNNINFIDDLIFIEESNFNTLSLERIKALNTNTILSIIASNIYHSLKISNVIVNFKIQIQRTEVGCFNSYDLIIVDNGNINTIEFNINHFISRESALLLKQEAYKNHNTVEALKFYSEEMRLHREEIRADINSILKNKNIRFLTKILEVSKKWADNFSLYSAYLFSNHGLNWLQALFWTLVLTFISFTIFYLDLKNIFCPYFFEEFIKYIIPTNYEILYKYVSLDIKINIFTKICGAIVYLFGKIVFGYGFYHVVISFKKFLRSN